MTLSLVSWNVNGVRACIQKGLLTFLREYQPQIFCLQEIKISEQDLKLLLPFFENLDYQVSWSIGTKKGYSGVLIGSRLPVANHFKGLPEFKDDPEGRVITLEYDNFWLVNAYFPNAQRELTRLDYKLSFNHSMASYCESLRQSKPVILTGDLNVAHREIDLANPKLNINNAGFTLQERQWLDNFINLGYVDTFREFNQAEGQYTWWTYRQNARERNIGWRLDYFLASQELKGKLLNSSILSSILGSDHCPVGLELKV